MNPIAWVDSRSRSFQAGEERVAGPKNGVRGTQNLRPHSARYCSQRYVSQAVAGPPAIRNHGEIIKMNMTVSDADPNAA
jgi:hypothetical protein